MTDGAVRAVSRPRVAFVGNQDNNAYRLCRWLRELGFDSHLFIHPDNLTQRRSHPALVSPGLDIAACPWTHIYSDLDAWYPYFGKTPASRRIENDFDAVVTSGSSVMFGLQFDRIPVFHIALGGDVRDIPRIGWFGPHPFDEKIRGFIFRKALRHCTRIFSGMSGGTAMTMRELRMQGRVTFVSLPEDQRHNLDVRDETLLARLNDAYGRYDKVFLWLSRLNYQVRDNQYKGADSFLQAFARIAKTRNVRAVVARHGNDADAFHALAGELGVLEHIDFVDHLSFWELATYLSISNAVVFDSLLPGSNAIGGLTREALSVGACVVRQINIEIISVLYGSRVPLRVAHDADDCHAAMLHYLDMSAEEFAALRESVLTWAGEHLDYRRSFAMRQIACELTTYAWANTLLHREFAVSRRGERAILFVQRLLLMAQRKFRTLLRRNDGG